MIALFCAKIFNDYIINTFSRLSNKKMEKINEKFISRESCDKKAFQRIDFQKKM